MADKKIFTTTQTPLSAWFITSGFNLQKIDILDFPATMFFEDSEDLQKAKHLWETGQAEGNCNQFFDNYRMLIKQVKPSSLWQGQTVTP